MAHRVLSEMAAASADAAIANKAVRSHIAIDSPETHAPEGVFRVERLASGEGFRFISSTIDSSALEDGAADSIRRMHGELTECGDTNISDIDGLRNFHFGHPRPMPAISLIGDYQPGRKNPFVNLEFMQTSIQARCFATTDRQLRRMFLYRRAAELAAEIRGKKEDPAQLSPATVAGTYAHTLSIGAAELAVAGALPPLLYPERSDLRFKNGETVSAVRVSVTPRSFLDYKPHETLDIFGSNIRRFKTRQRIDVVLLSEFLRTGQAVLNTEELQLFADWFNTRKLNSEEAKQGSKVVNAAEFLAGIVSPSVTLG